MLKTGMGFYELKRKGLFKFINLPSLADIGLIEFLISYLTRYVKEMGTRRLVIDNISPIFDTIGGRKVRRFLKR